MKSVLKLLYALYTCDDLLRRRALRQELYSNIQVPVLTRDPKTSRASPDALGYIGSTERDVLTSAAHAALRVSLFTIGILSRPNLSMAAGLPSCNRHESQYCVSVIVSFED